MEDIIRRGNTKDVLKLLTTKYETANSICNRAKGKPYKHYISYVRNLELLFKDKLVEKMEIDNKKNTAVYWRLKSKK